MCLPVRNTIAASLPLSVTRLKNPWEEVGSSLLGTITDKRATSCYSILSSYLCNIRFWVLSGVFAGLWIVWAMVLYFGGNCAWLQSHNSHNTIYEGQQFTKICTFLLHSQIFEKYIIQPVRSTRPSFSNLRRITMFCNLNISPIEQFFFKNT
jgi:hypothetical protein